MKRISYLLAMAAAVLAVACQKEVQQDALNVDSSTIVVSNEGATQNLVFSSNADWTVEADQDFITFDRTSGSAGNNLTVVMTVAPNTGFAARTAKVTIKAGSKSTVFNIEQKEVSTFSSALVYNIDSKAQDIEIKVEGNVTYTVTVAEDTPWITVTQTKAEPVAGTIKLHVTANSQLGPRTGHFTLSTDASSQTYEVVQGADWTPATEAAAIYVGLRDYFYADAYQTSPQTVLEMVTEGGDQIVIVLNLGEEPGDVTVVPTGTFVPDQEAGRAAGTFALKGGIGRFYSYLVEGGRTIDVVDGEVTVAEENGNVVITAALVDITQATHSYSYEGPIAVEDQSFSILVMEDGYYTPTFDSTTDTYYTTKANRWQLTIWPTAAPSADVPALSYINFTLYTEAGEVDGTEFPVGTFKYVASIPESETVAYYNGKKEAQPGTFTDFSANDIPQVPSRIKEGTEATLVIAKNEDGTYKISFTATLEEWEYVLDEDGNYTYDENWNTITKVLRTYDYAIEDDSVVIPAAKKGMQPYPDVDVEITTATIPMYSGLYFGEALGEGYNAFILQFNYLNNTYTCNMVVTVPVEEWVFEDNIRTNYCGTPLPDGTYTFSNSIGNKAIVPAKFGGQLYSVFNNGWTGTPGSIASGSITIEGTQVTFDLYVQTGNSDNLIHVTGSPALSLQAVRNYASRASLLTL
ncbi:MAG: BACON domain-containing protein [Bacteroidales bacterium]|nr:BACON domain-containing protein [Bacteroidales bacterium]